MPKIEAKHEIPGKPLPGQRTLPGVEQGEAGTGDEATIQLTIRVNAEAVRILTAFADREDLKRNRLFDEAIQMYAAVVARGLRTQKGR